MLNYQRVKVSKDFPQSRTFRRSLRRPCWLRLLFSSRTLVVNFIDMVAWWLGVGWLGCPHLWGYNWLIWYSSGWWFQRWILFSIIYGMSSFPLTNSYFSRWLFAPPTSYWHGFKFQFEWCMQVAFCWWYQMRYFQPWSTLQKGYRSSLCFGTSYWIPKLPSPGSSDRSKRGKVPLKSDTNWEWENNKAILDMLIIYIYILYTCKLWRPHFDHNWNSGK